MGASPSDRRNLAPVDVRENSGWLQYIRDAFLTKYPGGLGSARGNGIASDMNRILMVGRVPIDQRKGVSAAKLGSGPRGHAKPIPTPQALIQQVTGIGDSRAGR
jgi:hypothetical protein